MIVMALTGKAKTDYQREYMRRRRSNKPTVIHADPVRPVTLPVRPTGISNNQWNYIQWKASNAGAPS